MHQFGIHTMRLGNYLAAAALMTALQTFLWGQSNDVQNCALAFTSVKQCHHDFDNSNQDIILLYNVIVTNDTQLYKYVSFAQSWPGLTTEDFHCMSHGSNTAPVSIFNTPLVYYAEVKITDIFGKDIPFSTLHINPPRSIVAPYGTYEGKMSIGISRVNFSRVIKGMNISISFYFGDTVNFSPFDESSKGKTISWSGIINDSFLFLPSPANSN